MSWEIFTGLSGAVLGWLGLMEKRINTLKQEVNEKIEAVKELQEVERRNLESKVESVEKKLDYIIEHLITRRD